MQKWDNMECLVSWCKSAGISCILFEGLFEVFESETPYFPFYIEFESDDNVRRLMYKILGLC